MLKKHLIFLMLAVMAVVTANAGTWKLHNYYVTAKIQNVYDTGNKIYYLNSNRLFQFDKTTLETVALTKQNILSDNQISQIYYDWENKLLFVAYLSSNIDIIDENGAVSNVSGIKDVIVRVHDYAVASGEVTSYVGKTINDITFANGKAYVAIGYGYVIIDEATKSIKKSYDMGESITINSVAMVGDKLVILSGRNCYYGDPNDENPTTTFNKIPGNYGGAKLYPVNENTTFLLASQLSYIDFSEAEPAPKALVNAEATIVQKSPTGYIANFAGKAYYYTIDATGHTATKASSVIGFATSDPNGDGTVWLDDANGIHIKGSTTYYKVNSITTDQPYWLKYNAAMDVLFAAVSGPISRINSNKSSTPNVINTYDGTTWSNATVYSGSYTVGYGFEFSPLDPTTYVRGSWAKGIYKVKDNMVVTNYTTNNAKIGTYKPTLAFDKYGNMWSVCSYNNPTAPVSVLPADKFALTTANKDDWFVPSGLLALNTQTMQRSRFIISKKNNVKIYCDGEFPNSNGAGHFYFWDNGNVDPTVDTYRLADVTSFVDQEEKQVSWTYVNHMEQDKDGLIWVGHTTGLFIFDPEQAFELRPKAIHPFVTKFSEGTGYLCENFSVYDIGVDRDNNKWIASDDGVYFVSPDGTEVFNHFTLENSDLPSNIVYSVECDTINDRVYIYTDNGFAEYISTGDAACLNFDNVYAFPNPIEPDFTGMVKIANLMEDSYVTITNREGNVVAQMGPVMGCALWDGSDASGERVPTGIYKVYATQGAQPATSGEPLTTIMVIK